MAIGGNSSSPLQNNSSTKIQWRKTQQGVTRSTIVIIIIMLFLPFPYKDKSILHYTDGETQGTDGLSCWQSQDLRIMSHGLPLALTTMYHLGIELWSPGTLL